MVYGRWTKVAFVLFVEAIVSGARSPLRVHGGSLACLQRTVVVRSHAPNDAGAGCWRIFWAHAGADVRGVIDTGTALAIWDPLRWGAGSGRHVPDQRDCVPASNAI